MVNVLKVKVLRESFDSFMDCNHHMQNAPAPTHLLSAESISSTVSHAIRASLELIPNAAVTFKASSTAADVSGRTALPGGLAEKALAPVTNKENSNERLSFMVVVELLFTDLW